MDPNLLAPPPWVQAALKDARGPLAPEALMALAVAIAKANAEHGRGPFGAVLADAEGHVVDVGWNAVVATKDSTAHAEVLAIRRAERAFGTHDLAGLGLRLYASCAPCIQCFGAIYWSGLAEVLSAASKADAESIGFREGPVDEALWARARDERGVAYRPGFGDAEAAKEPFRVYRERGGPVY